ncbi:MAG: hypothetical protein Q6365_010930 [Candidatus Sigynarchaeota archaeon]
MAILLASGTADQLNAAALDEKLAAMPGIYYRVQHFRESGVTAPRPSIEVERARAPPSSRSRAPATLGTSIESRPSRPPRPVLVRPGCLLGRELLRDLTAAGVAARLDGAIAGDIALPDGRGIRVITTGDAEYWDAGQLRPCQPGVARPVVAVYMDGSDRREGAILSMLQKKLGRTGIEVWRFAFARELVTLINT